MCRAAGQSRCVGFCASSKLLHTRLQQLRLVGRALVAPMHRRSAKLRRAISMACRFEPAKERTITNRLDTGAVLLLSKFVKDGSRGLMSVHLIISC